jgi:alanine racemase
MAYANGSHHFSVFDVQKQNQIKTELEDKATVMVMGLVQDEDMEWVVANVGFCFLIKLDVKRKNNKKLDKKQLYTLKLRLE